MGVYKVISRLFACALPAEAVLEVLVVAQVAFDLPRDIVLEVLLSDQLNSQPSDLRFPSSAALWIMCDAKGFSELLFRPALPSLDYQPLVLITERSILLFLSFLQSLKIRNKF